MLPPLRTAAPTPVTTLKPGTTGLSSVVNSQIPREPKGEELGERRLERLIKLGAQTFDLRTLQSRSVSFPSEGSGSQWALGRRGETSLEERPDDGRRERAASKALAVGFGGPATRRPPEGPTSAFDARARGCQEVAGDFYEGRRLSPAKSGPHPCRQGPLYQKRGPHPSVERKPHGHGGLTIQHGT